MKKLNKENLGGLYADLVSYGIVNVFLCLLWILLGGGFYWPGWVTVIWGAILLVQAAHIGFVPQIGMTRPFLKSFPLFRSAFPFLNDYWIEGMEVDRVKPSIEKTAQESKKAIVKTAFKVVKHAPKKTKKINKSVAQGEDNAPKALKEGKKTVAKGVKKPKKGIKKASLPKKPKVASAAQSPKIKIAPKKGTKK